MSYDSQASPGGKQEHLYKVLVIGDLGTGKTSIIKRYVHQFFSPHYRATVSTFSLTFSASFTSYHFLSSSILLEEVGKFNCVQPPLRFSPYVNPTPFPMSQCPYH